MDKLILLSLSSMALGALLVVLVMMTIHFAKGGLKR